MTTGHSAMQERKLGLYRNLTHSPLNQSAIHYISKTCQSIPTFVNEATWDVQSSNRRFSTLPDTVMHEWDPISVITFLLIVLWWSYTSWQKAVWLQGFLQLWPHFSRYLFTHCFMMKLHLLAKGRLTSRLSPSLTPLQSLSLYSLFYDEATPLGKGRLTSGLSPALTPLQSLSFYSLFYDEATPLCKGRLTSGLSPALPSDSAMPSLRHWENLSLPQLFKGNSRLACVQINDCTFMHATFFFSTFSVYVCLLIVWQKECSSMCQEYGSPMVLRVFTRWQTSSSWK